MVRIPFFYFILVFSFNAIRVGYEGVMEKF